MRLTPQDEFQNAVEGRLHARHTRATMDYQGTHIEPTELSAGTARDVARGDVADIRSLTNPANVLGASLAIGSMLRNEAYRNEMELLAPEAALRAKVLVVHSARAGLLDEEKQAIAVARARGDRSSEATVRRNSMTRQDEELRAVAAMPDASLPAYITAVARGDIAAERRWIETAVTKDQPAKAIRPSNEATLTDWVLSR